MARKKTPATATYDLSGLSNSELRKLKNYIDDVLLNAQPAWDDIKPGDTFNYRGYEWVCLDPKFKAIGGTGCLSIMKQIYKDEVRFSGDNSNDYSNSDLHKLFCELTKELQNATGDIFIKHKIDQTAENGNEGPEIEEAGAFPLSIQEYVKYAKFCPRYDNWVWLRSPIPSGAYVVRIVYTDGSLSGNSAYGALGAAPACIFNRIIRDDRREG